MAIPVVDPTKKKKYFGQTEDPTANLFSGLPTGEESNPTQALVGKNLQGMLSGASYDASKTQGRETLARAATNLRAQTGGQVAEGGFLGQGAANKAQQGTEQSIFQGLSDSENQMAVETQAMKERGVAQATEIGTQQQNVVTQRRGQDISLLQSREQTQAQKEIAAMNITSNEKMAANALMLDYKKLDESARQFNVSRDDAVKNASDLLKFNYYQLDVGQKQFLASLGLDQAKFEASKEQFSRQLEQEGRLTMAQLGVQEKQIAEGARQFDNKLDFDKSELAANLTEAEKNRVWQAVQNDKAATNAKTIATMQNDTERWKTDQTALLTQKGWTVQQAESALDRTLQEALQNKSLQVQKEIESGRLTETQAARLQQADQFTDELEWNKEATRLGLSADEAARTWQTKERIENNAFIAGESNLGRQLEKEIQSGTVRLANGTYADTIQQQQILQSASQFQDQLAWEKKATELGLDADSAKRVWQSSENAKDRVQQANLQQLQNAFTEKEWNFQSLMSALDYLPEQQVAEVLNSIAANSGVMYDTGEKDAEGNPITAPGFKKYAPVFSTEDENQMYADLAAGKTLTETAVKILDGDLDNLVRRGKAVTDNGVETMNIAQWRTDSGKNRWVITQDAKNWVVANKDKLYKASNGRMYIVLGTGEPTGRLTSGAIVFKDVITGQTVSLSRGSTFPEVGV